MSKVPTTKRFQLDNLREVRESLQQNQGEFWHRFGVSQSGGSRYEGGRDVPRPLQKLLRLYFAKKISEADLLSV